MFFLFTRNLGVGSLLRYYLRVSIPFLLFISMAIHYYKEVITISLSINDARIFSIELKKARKKKRLTQAECAELLDHSLSFQKDLERCRCSPSIENFYHICRTLGISADSCIFPENPREDSTYQELLRLLSQCDEKSLSVLVAVAEVLVKPESSAVPMNMEVQ